MTDSHLVHEALADLITALEGHLSACQRRMGENDPEVQVAYETLRAAALHYDDRLFDAYEEVTPFEVESSAGAVEPQDLAAGGRFALLVRRDYVVDDVAALLEVGRRSQREMWQDDDETAAEEVDQPARAVYQMLHSQGVDGLAALAEDAGLVPLGGTLWLQVIEADDDTLTEEPFEVADEELVVYRVDELYDEDAAEDVVGGDLGDGEAADEEDEEDEEDDSAGPDDEADELDEAEPAAGEGARSGDSPRPDGWR